MASIEQQFKNVQEKVAAESPELRALQQQLNEEELRRLQKEHPRLAMLFDGAQQYIQELERKNRELEQAAHEHKELSEKDELTGLLNLRGFEARAKAVYEMVARGKTGMEKRLGMDVAFNVIFVDLNDFKPVNDTYGHEAGDEALKRVAQALIEATRKGDLVARKGGDEFVVAYLGRESESGSRGIAAENRSVVSGRITHALERSAFEYKGKTIPALTACIGAAKAMPDEGLNEVIHRADLAVLQAKSIKNKARGEGGASQSYVRIAEGVDGSESSAS